MKPQKNHDLDRQLIQLKVLSGKLSAKLLGRQKGGPDSWALVPVILLLMVIAAPAAMAQEAAAESGSLADSIFQPIVDVLTVLLFFKIGGENGFPFISAVAICSRRVLHLSHGVYQL